MAAELPQLCLQHSAVIVGRWRTGSHSGRRWRFVGYAFIAFQRKCSYQFHPRWDANLSLLYAFGALWPPKALYTTIHFIQLRTE